MTGAPMPSFSSDPVVDFCVKEVIATKVGAAKKIAEKKAETERWKKGDTSHLEGHE